MMWQFAVHRGTTRALNVSAAYGRLVTQLRWGGTAAL